MSNLPALTSGHAFRIPRATLTINEQTRAIKNKHSDALSSPSTGNGCKLKKNLSNVQRAARSFQTIKALAKEAKKIKNELSPKAQRVKQLQTDLRAASQWLTACPGSSVKQKNRLIVSAQKILSAIQRQQHTENQVRELRFTGLSQLRHQPSQERPYIGQPAIDARTRDWVMNQNHQKMQQSNTPVAQKCDTASSWHKPLPTLSIAAQREPTKELSPPPPPPPALPSKTANSATPGEHVPNLRDAFLKQIRDGVRLKKVEQADSALRDVRLNLTTHHASQLVGPSGINATAPKPQPNAEFLCELNGRVSKLEQGNVDAKNLDERIKEQRETFAKAWATPADPELSQIFARRNKKNALSASS